MVAGIDVQFVVSGCSYPFCWHADELEDEDIPDDFDLDELEEEPPAPPEPPVKGKKNKR